MGNLPATRDAVLVATSGVGATSDLAELVSRHAVRVVKADSWMGIVSTLGDRDVGLALIEIGVPAIGGLRAFRRLQSLRPDIALLAIAPTADRQQLADVFDAGARGLILATEAATELAKALECIHDGKSYVPPSFEWKSLDEAEATALHLPPELKLSMRQRQLLPLVARGWSNKQIAQQLEISVATAKFHVATLLRSLNSNNRTEAASKATLLMRKRSD